jgi:hypothetical protein
VKKSDRPVHQYSTRLELDKNDATEHDMTPDALIGL